MKCLTRPRWRGGTVLAEDFGYQLSPKPASAMTPRIQREVDKAREETAAKAARSKSGENVVFGIVFTGSIVIALAARTPWVFFVGLFGSLLLSSAVGQSWATSAKAAGEKLQELTTPVLGGRWQTWPCRMEAVAGLPRRRVLLLDPEGAVAVQFLSAVPEKTWLGMTDGRGLVWFVGDMRFGGMMALPGGDPVWWTGAPVVSQTPPQSSGVQRVVEEELARQAVKFAFDKWLG